MNARRGAAIMACLVAAAVLAAGCGTSARAPVSTRDRGEAAPASAPVARQDGIHVVAAGETLYSIAWRYGHDYRDLARWNGINDPYFIYPKQHIRVTPPVVAPAPRTAARTGAAPARTLPPRADTVPRGAAPSAREAAATALSWLWPTAGELLQTESPIGRKGIDIGGKLGQPINAAAAGSVVYSGSGLFGYGRLIIIKHNDTYLSAYAHNDKLLVKEGDAVGAGQQIGTMGLGNGGRPVLHFEIRKDGKPVNPLEHLPKFPS